MANTKAGPRHVRIACGNATTAQVNTGQVIVPAIAGRSIVVVGGWLRALGGNASGATSVDIASTGGSPVTAAAVPVASLTSGTVAAISAGTATNMGAALEAGRGLQITKTGASLATATSVDYCIEYVYL